jgi:hypothetical protein
MNEVQIVRDKIIPVRRCLCTAYTTRDDGHCESCFNLLQRGRFWEERWKHVKPSGPLDALTLPALRWYYI